MADFTRGKSIKYLNRDFDSFVRDLLRFTEARHSGVFKDTNESSPGMALLEQAAYIGDTLSFYLDKQFSELKQGSARELKNVVANAKMKGYRPSGKRAARGRVAVMVEVPATTDGRGRTIPDESFSPILRRGARFGGPNGTAFESLDNVPFSASIGREVTGSQFDQTTGLPTHFALRKTVDVVAGETKTDVITVGSFEKFKTVELQESDVIEVLSAFDSDGNEWVEVDYLAQETVFTDDNNTNEDSDVVPYVLKLRSVPRRFVSDRDPLTGKTSLIFGAGEGVDFDDELVPNLADLALPLAGRDTFTSFPLDPQNFLKTRSLGLGPSNTVLTVNYRVGGGLETNVPPGSIKSVTSAVLDFTSNNLSPSKKSAVEQSLEVINLKKTSGGGPEETISEIKANDAAHFATQERVVTKEDYISRVLTIPERFGKPDKVFVKRNNSNSFALDLHVLTRDSNGHLDQPTQTLKKNIQTYLSRFRMVTDGINILDANVINLRCNFGVVVAPKFNRSEVITKCLSVVMDYLDTEFTQIGQPIVLSDLSAEIQAVLGVISVYELRFTNVIGVTDSLEYSNTRFDVLANTANRIVYCPENAIFEVKYPRRDIVGVGK